MNLIKLLFLSLFVIACNADQKMIQEAENRPVKSASSQTSDKEEDCDDLTKEEVEKKVQESSLFGNKGDTGCSLDDAH